MGSAVAVITVRAHMVVGDIGEFLYGSIQLFFRLEAIQVGTLIFKSVKVPFHWRIVVWISDLAHALGYMN